jgi:hypothetical protein
MFFSIISVTTDAILAAACNHLEKIGSHGQSRWKNNRVGREPEPQVFFRPKLSLFELPEEI